MNNVTRDVIIDLWSLYEEGEASADTRSLVEGFLANDPGFAAQIERRFDAPGPSRLPVPRPDAQLAALTRTRRVIRKRSAYLASAILFSLWPLSFAWNGDRITWMFAQTPAVLVAMWFVAAVLWVAYVRQRRALRASEV